VETDSDTDTKYEIQ